MSESGKPELDLPACLEALLFVSAEPVSAMQLATTLEVSVAAVEEGLKALEGELQSRGLRLQRHGGRVQLTTAPEMAFPRPGGDQPPEPGRPRDAGDRRLPAAGHAALSGVGARRQQRRGDQEFAEQGADSGSRTGGRAGPADFVRNDPRFLAIFRPGLADRFAAARSGRART